MYLRSLTLMGLRNLEETTLSLSPHFNLFFGKNGSGKTSLLEAVYLLTTGRSFRTAHAEECIAHSSENCVLSAQLCRTQEEGGPLRIGIKKERRGGLVLRVDEKTCSTRAELAKILPIQVMNTESYQLLHLPPQHRREFLDWGMFHVEHSFFSLWQRYSRALKQRNAALKRVRQEGEAAVYIWDAELIDIGESIHQSRQRFLDSFTPFFKDYLKGFLKIEGCELDYHKGWQHKALQEAFLASRSRDLALGYTSAGAHRADIKFYLDGLPVHTLFSRGQLKLFVSALMLARSAWLLAQTGRHSVFLLDDLHSELDKGASLLLLEGLKQMGGQVWITAIEEEQVQALLRQEDLKMFHVEHGRVEVVQKMFHVEHFEAEATEIGTDNE